MNINVATIFVCWLVALLALYMIGRHIAVIRRGESRLSQYIGENEKEVLDYDVAGANPLRRWLFLAGFRSKDAVGLFLVVAVVFFVLGAVVASGFVLFGFFAKIRSLLLFLPQGIGDIFIPVLMLCVPLIFLFFAMLPWYMVYAARKRRIEKIDQDMSIFLELMATMSESGLSFDAAVERVLHSFRRERPLSVELRTFQSDVLSGRPRTECLRRFARRIEIIPVTAFISAVVLAEQVGSSLSDVLRRQSEEVRSRRRERALEAAMSAPVKRVVPLVLCFLPAIFVVAIGPLFYQIFTTMDTLTRMRGDMFRQ